MANPGGRPLSPHMQIWKWGPAMAVSILHRITGDGMAIVGGILLTWWLAAAASGAEAYAKFIDCFTYKSGDLNIFGFVILIGLTWAFFEHLLSGIRHLLLDTGAGFELKTNNMWSNIIPVAAILLTAAFWMVIMWKGLA